MCGDSNASRQSDDRADVFGFPLCLDTAIPFLGIFAIVIQQRSHCRQSIQPCV